MGNACIDNYLPNLLLKSTDSVIYLENGENYNQQNKLTNKKAHILYKSLENNNEEKDLNKRYSDFHNYESKYSEKYLNTKNIGTNGNKTSKNTSINEASFINQKNNNINNEDMNKLISSNNNSNYFNASPISPVITNEKKDNHNLQGKNKSLYKGKHNSVMKKINDINMKYRNSETKTNFNCNLGDNNVIFINISRGSKLIDKKDIKKTESTTPKMRTINENFVEATDNKNLFSHFCNNRMNNISQKGRNNEINDKITNSAFMNTFDMNKYSEEMLNVLNSIRINPESFINNIDYLINNNIQKTEEGIFLVSQEHDEKIKLMDNYNELFDKTKDFLRNKISSNKKSSNLEKLKYDENLEICLDKSNNDEDSYNYEECPSEENEDNLKNLPLKLNLIYDEDIIIDDSDDDIDMDEKNIDIVDFDFEDEKDEDNGNKNKIIKLKKINHSSNKKVTFKQDLKQTKNKGQHNINNYLDLNDDKIGNLVLKKRKKIKKNYPLNIFKISVIKDIKISILTQLVMEEVSKEDKKNLLKQILFSQNYKYFGISWTNEVNRNFISISCFA